eukprot:scaffold8226_cov286-Pinguiococcus_pyrenoidosus.AAC.5
MKYTLQQKTQDCQCPRRSHRLRGFLYIPTLCPGVYDAYEDLGDNHRGAIRLAVCAEASRHLIALASASASALAVALKLLASCANTSLFPLGGAADNGVARRRGAARVGSCQGDPGHSHGEGAWKAERSLHGDDRVYRLGFVPAGRSCLPWQRQQRASAAARVEVSRHLGAAPLAATS